MLPRELIWEEVAPPHKGMTQWMAWAGVVLAIVKHPLMQWKFCGKVLYKWDIYHIHILRITAEPASYFMDDWLRPSDTECSINLIQSSLPLLFSLAAHGAVDGFKMTVLFSVVRHVSKDSSQCTTLWSLTNLAVGMGQLTDFLLLYEIKLFKNLQVHQIHCFILRVSILILSHILISL